MAKFPKNSPKFSKISLHDNFFSTNIICDIREKIWALFNSKWTNHTWAWRMKLYCFVIKKSHSVWSKSFIWEWSIFEKPVENEIQWKTHSIFFWCTLRLIAKRLEQLDGFFDLFLQPFWSYWRWTFFCFIVEGYCHISNRHFLIFLWNLWRVHPLSPF